MQGRGSAFAAFEHGLSTPVEYVASANDSVVVMLPIESIEGRNDVDEICQVQGVDRVFIGPNDLALALLGSTPAKYTEAKFLAAIDKIVGAARTHDKEVGMLVADGEQACAAKERFDLIAIGTDVRAMQALYRAALEKARS